MVNTREYIVTYENGYTYKVFATDPIHAERLGEDHINRKTKYLEQEIEYLKSKLRKERTIVLVNRNEHLPPLS